jgi:TPR repeat protein/serine/threonine protein kinase
MSNRTLHPGTATGDTGGSNDPAYNPPTPAVGKGTPHTSPLAPPQQPDEIGRLGRYRILRELGRGGMGIVYLAEDAHLRRRVAVKCLLPEVASRPGNRDRFEREAWATAKVEHENLIPIYDVGEDRGVPFLVMPLLRGETLGDRLRRVGRLPLHEVVRVGREMARGLGALHAAGLVHRDIKPGNVWLEADSERVKILDFGLARPDDGSEAISLSGQVMGTPGYMAPEQVTGEPLDHRADLFSLGCILYEMATGKQAFDGPNVLALLANLALQAPVPPQSHNPDIPPALSALIMSLIEKQPDRRPSSALDVRDTLDRFINLATGRDEYAPTPQPPSFTPRLSAATIPSGPQVRPPSGPPTEPDSASVPPTAAEHAHWKVPGKAWAALTVAGGVAALLVVVVVIAVLNGNGVSPLPPPPEEDQGGLGRALLLEDGLNTTVAVTKSAGGAVQLTEVKPAETSPAQLAEEEYRAGLQHTTIDPVKAVALFRSAAEKGHAAGQYRLAQFLLYGYNTVPVDRQLAVNWATRSAEQGYAPAQSLLGHLISQEGKDAGGAGEAGKWFARSLPDLSKSAASGDTESAYALGLKHLWSAGQTDTDTSVRWMTSAAKAGHPDAMYRLGRAYDYGMGVIVDPVEAVRWYSAAAERGHVLAAATLGLLECDGWGGPKNEQKGLERLKAISSEVIRLAEAGDPEAEVQLGIMYARGRGVAHDESQAANWYKSAVTRGDPVAANRLAGYYMNRPDDHDREQAVRLYRLAADMGLPIAQYNLGDAYRRGAGVKRNEATAVQWYSRAAAAELPDALLALGLLYTRGGAGVPQNDAEAARWYARAAERYRSAAIHGDARAQYYLGQLYHRGLGVAADKIEAARWYRKAANQGHQDASKALEQLKVD